MKKTVIILLLLLSTIAYSSDQTLPKVSSPVSRSGFDEGVKIKLVLGDKTYELRSYSISYYRANKVKDNSNVSSGVSPYQRNTLNVNLRSSKIDQELLNWLLSAEQQSKDGQIIVTDIDSAKTLKTVTFTGANTYSYNESNNNNSLGNNLQNASFSLNFSSIAIRY